MQRLLGLAAATALILGATVAYADQITGIVKNLDPVRSTFVVGDTLFTAAANNTAGTALKNIKEGDKVTVMYEKSTSGAKTNATSITKEND
jgi:Cu/Ag efflux protein CusF